MARKPRTFTAALAATVLRVPRVPRQQVPACACKDAHAFAPPGGRCVKREARGCAEQRGAGVLGGAQARQLQLGQPCGAGGARPENKR
jgi:hypothetical protein